MLKKTTKKRPHLRFMVRGKIARVLCHGDARAPIGTEVKVYPYETTTCNPDQFCMTCGKTVGELTDRFEGVRIELPNGDTPWCLAQMLDIDEGVTL